MQNQICKNKLIYVTTKLCKYKFEDTIGDQILCCNKKMPETIRCIEQDQQKQFLKALQKGVKQNGLQRSVTSIRK